MALLTLLDPAGSYKRVTVRINPAMFAFLRHKGYLIMHATPV